MAGLLDGMEPGDGLLVEYAPGLLGPFQAAALRQRMAVRPMGGRLPGGMTRVAERYLPHVLGNIATLPQRAVEASANYRATGQDDPVFLEAALTPMMGAMPSAARGAVGAMGGKPTPPRTTLPMDEASRMARAVREMNYADEPFYRGESGAPTEYPGGFFSRSKEYSDGFARKEGNNEAREFRLNLQNAYIEREPLTAEKFGRLVGAARETDPALALKLVQEIAPGRDVDWMLDFAKARPDTVVARGTGPALIRLGIERGSKNWEDVFRRAGFDTIDAGRDVLKLSGEGIRLKEAAFDPRRAHERNILASLLGLSAVPAVPAHPSQE